MDDVSLDIHAGETLGLVGESGSGKSTLGRLVLRLIEPTSGSVRYEGTDLLGASHREMRRLRRDMQIIFQDPFGSLDPRMRVEDVIAEPLVIHGERERLGQSAPPFAASAKGGIRARVAELLRAVGLDESALRRFPHEFSGGQRQRIVIARALALAAKVHRGRRTGFRPRRQRRRANREPAGPAAARVRADLSVHLALHAGGALSGDAHRGDVSRQAGRGRDD